MHSPAEPEIPVEAELQNPLVQKVASCSFNAACIFTVQMLWLVYTNGSLSDTASERRWLERAHLSLPIHSLWCGLRGRGLSRAHC